MDPRNDLEAICREQLDSFRIKELKDVLARLGLPKQGKKQVLRDKIMAIFAPGERQPGLRGRTLGREETARVIADIYRKRQGPAAPDLATGRNATAAGSSSAARSDEPENEVTNEDAKIRCPCGSASDAGTMIQCDDARKCGVWQHINCVLIPDKGEEGREPEVPPQFYCELCRVAQGDPFCTSLANTLLPVKLSRGVTAKVEGSVVLMFNVEKTFRISRSEKELISRPGHDLQVWCVLLSDKVPFRIHWPIEANLRINGNSVRVVNRPAQQLLGLNGRDEGPSIANLVKEGDNELSFWTNDSRQFCIGIRIIHRLTVPEVLEQIPDEATGEKFEEALARVRRSVIGVGSGAADEDDDDDLVVSDIITVNLRCPLSSSRIKMAGRFKPCPHMGCFDMETLVEINQRARKWQCPICMKNYSLEQLIIDPFFSRVASAMKGYGEDVTEVEMKADGFWRPKLEGDARSKEPWRTPEGSVVVANGVNKSMTTQPVLIPVKLEGGLSSHDGASLKLGMKRNREGQWIMNGTKRYNGVTSPNVAGPSQPQKPTIISRSTSATDSNDDGGNGDERSVNQGPSDRDIDRSVEDNVGQCSKPEQSSGLWDTGRSNDIPDGADVIVLSDTDDDADDIIVGSSGASMRRLSAQRAQRAAVCTAALSPELLSDGIPGDSDILQQTGGPDQARTSIPILQSFGQVHSAGAPLGTSATVANASGYLDKNNSFWSAQLANTPFSLYAPALDTAQPNVNLLTTPLRPTPVQAVEGASYGLVQPSSTARVETDWRGFARSAGVPPSYPDCNGYPADSGRVSPTESPLHIFLPSQPARAMETPLREPVLPEDEEINNSWFSLSLGGDMSLDAQLPTSAAVPATESHRMSPQGRGQLDSLASTANVLLGMTRHGSQSVLEPLRSPHRSQMHTTQRRSSSSTARHRRYYRIDSDSD